MAYESAVRVRRESQEEAEWNDRASSKEYIVRAVKECNGQGSLTEEEERLVDEKLGGDIRLWRGNDCVCKILVIIGKGHLDNCVNRVGNGERVDLAKIAGVEWGSDLKQEERVYIDEHLRVYL